MVLSTTSWSARRGARKELRSVPAAAAYMPAAHPTQPAEVDEPVVAKNVPAAQEVQEDAPVESA